MLERHRGADQLSHWINTYGTALNDPCTKAEYYQNSQKAPVSFISPVFCKRPVSSVHHVRIIRGA